MCFRSSCRRKKIADIRAPRRRIAGTAREGLISSKAVPRRGTPGARSLATVPRHPSEVGRTSSSEPRRKQIMLKLGLSLAAGVALLGVLAAPADAADKKVFYL